MTSAIGRLIRALVPGLLFAGGIAGLMMVMAGVFASSAEPDRLQRIGLAPCPPTDAAKRGDPGQPGRQIFRLFVMPVSYWLLQAILRMPEERLTANPG